MTCAKYNLKLGEHLLDHQGHNWANIMNTTRDNSINRQCHHYKYDQTNISSDEHKFDDLTTNNLIKLQNLLFANPEREKNLINTKNSADMYKFNLNDDFLNLQGLTRTIIINCKQTFGQTAFGL